MVKMIFTMLLIMSLLPSAIQSQPHRRAHSQGATKPEKKRLRILIEEHLEIKSPANATTMSEFLNQNAALYGFEFELLMNADQAYDARLIVTTGKGGMWCDNRHFMGSSYDPFYFATAVLLTPAGKTLFVATASHGSAYKTREMVAKQILTKLTEHSDALK